MTQNGNQKKKMVIPKSITQPRFNDDRVYIVDCGNYCVYMEGSMEAVTKAISELLTANPSLRVKHYETASKTETTHEEGKHVVRSVKKVTTAASIIFEEISYEGG